MNIYDYELIESIEKSSATESLKRNLVNILKEDYKVSKERMLVNVILRMDEFMKDIEERLIYAETNRTRPKDIMVGSENLKIILNKKDEGAPIL